jgi:hypothetical protein
MVRYSFYADHPSTEEDWLSLFTEDALIEGLRGYHVGVAGVKEFAGRAINRAPGEQSRHLMTNFRIDGDGDEGTMVAYSLRYTTSWTDPAKTGISGISVYDCDVRKVDGTWKFKRRTVKQDKR